jgi:hypothetical protein
MNFLSYNLYYVRALLDLCALLLVEKLRIKSTPSSREYGTTIPYHHHTSIMPHPSNVTAKSRSLRLPFLFRTHSTHSVMQKSDFEGKQIFFFFFFFVRNLVGASHAHTLTFSGIHNLIQNQQWGDSVIQYH